MELLGIGLDFMAVLITFVILVGVLLGKRNAMNEYFPILLLMNALTLLADMGSIAFSGAPQYLILMKTSVILRGAFAYVSVSGFNLYIDKIITRKLGKNVLWRMIPFVLSIIMILFWISSMLHGYVFSISDQGIFSQGQLYIVFVAGALIIPIVDFFRVVINHITGVLEPNICYALYIFIIIPEVVAFVAFKQECLSMLFAAITVSYLIMFIAIHVQTEQKVVEKKMDDTIMQTELIISQLQPHFMFNSLTNIKYLIKKDPDMAGRAIDSFTKYLRTNLEAIENPEYITFAQELEHTKNYLWMEQIRFSDLKVEYSIDVDDFMVPALSLQPIVENAVKHGVTKKIGGGTIKISVRDLPDCYKIIVKDDGVGFDINSKEEEETSASIKDIRKRLFSLNKSKMSISSTEGVGTTVIYTIVKGEG